MTNNNQYNEAKKFLDLLSLGNEGEVFHFQTFDDLKDTKRVGLIRVLVGTLDQHFDELLNLNNKGAGIFVCVNKIENSLKRDSKSVSKIRSVFADKDDGNFGSFPIEPSILVQTKNGQHAYWLTDEVSRDNFTEIQKSIINKLKTDISIHDLPRVMRLPGFYHRKDPNNPYFVNVLKGSNLKYSMSELTTIFPKIEQKNISVNSLKGNHIEVLRYIEKLEGAIQGHNGDLKTFQVACDLIRGFNLSDDDAILYFRKFNEKCHPAWSENDLQTKLQSARKSGSGDFGYLLKNITTEQWVYKFIDKNKVRTAYNQKIYFNEDLISVGSLIRKAEIEWDNEGRKSKINVIKSIFEEWEISSRKKILERTRQIFKFNSKLNYLDGEDLLTRYTRALVGNNCDKFEQHRAVIGHFIWQVKRKIFGYEVFDHICPVLVGKQGSGKTKAIDNLIRPLKHLSVEGNLGMFVREAEKFIFGTYYIVKLDEFAKGLKSDVDSMKAIITSTDINFRTFYTQKMAIMPNVATFIAASNRSVAEVFNDHTGNRRFYEIPCLDKLDWSEIGGFSEDQGLDYYQLWQSVNEESVSPASKFMSEISRYQEDFRARTIVEEWLTSEDLVPSTDDITEIIALKSLHRDFITWMKQQNCNFMYTDQRFGKELSKYLEQRKRNTGSHYIVKSKSLPPKIEHTSIPFMSTMEKVENNSSSTGDAELDQLLGLKSSSDFVRRKL